jgi:hypothetical protein
MRICFFIATKSGTGGSVLASAPNLFKIQPEDEQGNPIFVPMLAYTPNGDASNAVVCLLYRAAANVVHGGYSWTVWLLMPVSRDWRAGPKLVRKLIRSRYGDDVLGPYLKPELQRIAPSLHDMLCPFGGLPNVIAGDDPISLGKIDYAPSIQEADEDIEPSEDILNVTG